MFTGIIEEVGEVLAARFDEAHPRLAIGCRAVVAGARVGDSIAVDGVCLTVETFDAGGFTVGLMPETLRRTALGDLRPGRRVNLEGALGATGRIGGHFVQGHIDGVGRIVADRPEGEAVIVTIALPPELARYVVEKGFITVDGISLTVMAAAAEHFSVSLVRHTQEHTTLAGKPPGAAVNLEVDILAKYVERLLGGAVVPLALGAGPAGR